MPAKLKNGVIGAKGGKRKGAGRKPDEFKRIMAELASNAEAIKYFKKVLGRADDSDEFLVLQTGVQVPIRVDADTWLKFWKEAKDAGFGKATQPIEAVGEGSRLVFIHPISAEGSI